MEKEIKNTAPVILFAYNRPSLVRKTLRSLKANTLALQSHLFVFCDGPKENAGEADLLKINEVRQIVGSEQWCGDVTVIEHNENKGLAASVIDGVSTIVSKYGKVIVIEDDVLLSPYFLQFMNDALDANSDNKQVLSIGSWNYFCDPEKIENDFFYFRYPDSIAWATTAYSWSLFEKDAAVALDKLKHLGKLNVFNGDGEAEYFEDMLNKQIEGKVNSWAIRWTATAIVNNMLNVFPKYSLSKHIGFGADATHEKSEVDYNKDLFLAERKLSVDISSSVAENSLALREWKNFVNANFKGQPVLSGSNSSLYNRIRTKAYRMVHRVIDKVKPAKLSEADQLIEEALRFPRYKDHEFNYGKYRFKVSDFISVANQIKEYFDEEQLKFISNKEKPLIIDCGSNVGVSVIYFKSLYPQATIWAYEPDRKIFGNLTDNLMLNNVANVNVHNKAVWLHEDGVEFAAEGADGGSVYAEGPKTRVETVRLKNILNNADEVDLLKIDIEGAELAVLADCNEALRKVKFLFVEYHSLVNEKQQLDKLLSVLTENGFRYYINSIGSQAAKPFVEVNAYNGMDIQLNVFAVNRLL